MNLKLQPLKFSLNQTLFLILFMVGIFLSIAIQYIYRVLLQLSILLLVAESIISIMESTYMCMRL